MLGIQLTDTDVFNVPLLATDRYGEFLRGPNGFVQIVTASGLVEGDPAANGGLGVALPADTLRTGHAFLTDIAHMRPCRAPTTTTTIPPRRKCRWWPTATSSPAGAEPDLRSDAPITRATAIPGAAGRHLRQRDARPPLHHRRRPRQREHRPDRRSTPSSTPSTTGWSKTNKATILGSRRPGRHQRMAGGRRQPPSRPTPAAIAALQWDGERLFQAGRFVTEMQYQHLVFEEFARAHAAERRSVRLHELGRPRSGHHRRVRPRRCIASATRC